MLSNKASELLSSLRILPPEQCPEVYEHCDKLCLY